MAHIQPIVNIQPFKGLETENFDEFERQLTSSIGVAGIADADRHLYLHLHLKGGALAYFDQMPAATRQDYDLAIAALRQRYVNPQRQELKRIVFHSRKFKPEEETASDFLTELQRLAGESFPDVAAVAAAGGRPAVPAENRANERTRRVREAFINGLPNKLKRYLLTQPDNMPVDELCEKVSRRNVLDKLYPEDDPDTAFNEVSSTQMDSVATALNSLNKAQTTLQQQVNNMTNQIAALSQGPPRHWYPYPWQTEQPSHGNNRGWYGNNRGYRGYRGNNRGWRGNRGNYRGPNPNEDMTYSNQRHCRNCNSFGHTAQQCPTKPSPQHGAQLPYQQHPKN